MRDFIAFLIFIGGILLGLYVSVWAMFISPIIEACRAFDAGTLTGAMVGLTVIKCVFSSVVGYLITFVTTIISKIIEE